MQKNLFYGSLMDMLDSKDPLVVLADTIKWSKFEDEFAQYYSKEGRPAKPIRLMVGLLLLKQLENLSDENVVIAWKRNPYFQYFCGFSDFQTALPCHSTDLVYFRNRIGKKGFEFIFKHKGYEYGTKASVVTTKNSGIIVGVSAHRENEHDSKTLKLALENTISNLGSKTINEVICDRGYRGSKQIIINNETVIDISIPSNLQKKDTTKQINIKKEKFRRRAAIEPIIGHLKSDHRMQRNYLKGFLGDQINLLLAATAFNLKKWMNIYFYAFFTGNLSLLKEAYQQLQHQKELIMFLLQLKITMKFSNLDY